ncbi:MAG TPA: NAD(+)/NADH kinase [Vicinamibacterales bacterium]|nr:NAD(+)/NADH kinase [Vicinamibacterales bacterium]
MNATVTRVGIVAKSHLREATPHLIDIESWMAARQLGVLFETATAAMMPPKPSRRIAEKAALVTQVDLIVVLGGDGTLLSVANCVAAASPDVPILGVNFGSLGFLTEATLPELYASLDAAVSGQARVEERLMLRATTVRAGAPLPEQLALNDVVITKSARARMTDLSVCVGEEFVTRVKADGLIVATPTGSTAYNLAAGGPIVQPVVDALVLTPIAPHMLTNRPIVIPAASLVRVQPMMDDRDELYVTFDGQEGYQLEAGDEVRIRCAERRVRLLRPSSRSYFDVLRQKLKWNER